MIRGVASRSRQMELTDLRGVSQPGLDIIPPNFKKLH